MRRLRYAQLLMLVLVAWLAATTLLPVARAQGDFYLKEGDRVVFYGDSITDQRLYTTFVEDYVVTRFPRLDVQFVHSGWGGDRVTGGAGGAIDVRLSRDVIAYHPSVMTIMLGMNDGGYRPYDAALAKTYEEGYQHILNTVKSAVPGIRITLIQPSPYDDVTRPPTFEGGYNAVLIRYGALVKQLGEREHLTVVDMNAPVVAVLEKAKASDAKLAERIVPDRVHPGPSGHLVMAEALLEGWRAPATVTAVEIDAAGKRVVNAQNTTISALAANHGLSWTQTDQALPMPLNLSEPVVALALRCSNFVQMLDQQTLRVKELTAARYTLKIDGEEVGAFSNQELETGINLATLPTPMAKQAMAVHDLTVKHNNVHFARWREVQVPLQDDPVPHRRPAMSDLDSLENELIAQQRTAAQPQPRHYELIPQ